MPPFAASIRLIAAVVATFALTTTAANADPQCRVAFDMGSSGIRAGASDSGSTVKADLDTIGLQWTGKSVEELAEPTTAVLNDLLQRGGFKRECALLGGGMSAWRLALATDAAALAVALARIRAASGVAVLVMPPKEEGAYGYFAAREALGQNLHTSHVLDIGGGSLQIASEHTTFAAALGQKAWYRKLCLALRQTGSMPCALQPMSEADLSHARALLADELRDIETSLPGTTTMTAISRSVRRLVLPAVKTLEKDDGTGKHVLRRTSVSAAIDRLAPLTLAETTTQAGSPAPYVDYLLSNLLLVEGLMRRTGDADLIVAEVDVSNVAGLLADDRAFAWHAQHDCYLQRLRETGIDAYASDPASCLPQGHRRGNN